MPTRYNYRYEKERRLAQLRGESWSFPGIGYSRRIEALHTIGYSAAAIGEVAGMTLEHVHWRRKHPEAPIFRANKAGLDLAWEMFKDKPLPDEGIPLRTKRWARRMKFAPPMAWDDIDDPEDYPKGVLGWCKHPRCRNVDNGAVGLCRYHYAKARGYR